MQYQYYITHFWDDFEHSSLVFEDGGRRILYKDDYAKCVREETVIPERSRPVPRDLNRFMETIHEWSQLSGSSDFNQLVIYAVFLLCNKREQLRKGGDLYAKQFILRRVVWHVSFTDVVEYLHSPWFSVINVLVHKQVEEWHLIHPHAEPSH